jgi:lipoprotein-anchoring transpeptidase ErfK/SrfK
MKKLAISAALLWVLTASESSAMTITVDISTQRMQVKSTEGSYTWKVSTARAGYVTPAGNYKPLLLTPMHYSTRYHNSPMPYSIFFSGNFAIHGTNYVSALGRPASHGCVRLDTSNAKMLYNLVQQEGMQNVTIKIVP